MLWQNFDSQSQIKLFGVNQEKYTSNSFPIRKFAMKNRCKQNFYLHLSKINSSGWWVGGTKYPTFARKDGEIVASRGQIDSEKYLA